MVEGWLDLGDSRRTDGATRDAFQRVSPHPPRAAQRALADLDAVTAPSLAILEAETGSGKTEAALARFVALFTAGVVDGMYFALPTRTAATEIYARVFAAMQLAFATPPPVVLAVPGYFRVDDVEGRRLAPFDVLWPETDIEGFRYRSWAGESAKRYIAGCIVVGTIDQVLLSSLRVGHAHLRATALLRQFLVVDEVHASDEYMTRVLADVLGRHISAGGHALLLSATLGGEARGRLLAAGGRAQMPTLESATAMPYPLASCRWRHTVTIEIESDTPRDVEVDAEPWLEDGDTIAAAALAAAERGAKVLVIRNTVATCIAVQEALERFARERGVEARLFACEGRAAPHHSRFARPDREALDAALQKSLGGERSGGGCVVVATQTVQQSLDLDADLLMTDLCPMDVLLQRIGRLHRRQDRARPSGFATATAKVLVPVNRDLTRLVTPRGNGRHHFGLGSVYEDLRVIEATWREIESCRTWRIPEMSRRLVENSLHSEALARVCGGGPAEWKAHAQWAQGTMRGEGRQAQLNLVDWTTPYSESMFPDGERVPTRLGEGDRAVKFVPGFTGPFRFTVYELVLPERWVRGVAPTEDAARDVEQVGGATRFRFGSKWFNYDRHGVRPWHIDDKEPRDDDDGP
jgi:CRISPR-associated endonuclease/helicase Cas3